MDCCQITMGCNKIINIKYKDNENTVSIGECRILCLDKVSYLCTVILNYFKLWYKARNN